MSNARAAAVFIACCLFIARPAEAATLTLAWDAATDGITAGYIVRAGTASGHYPYSIDVGMVTSFTVPDLPGGTKVYFVVQSYSADGEVSLLSEEVSGTTPASVSCTPGAPSVATGVMGALVHVSWSPGSGNPPTLFSLDVGSAQGARDIATARFDASTRNLAATAPDGKYWLRMTAANTCGSGPATDAMVTVGPPTIPPAPTALSQQVTGQSVQLSWTAPPASDVTRYLVDVSDTAGNPLVTFDTGSRATSLAHQNVPLGDYVVRIRAVNAAGVGDPSNPILVRVRP